jgi:glycosyltransferase involved in cell wall biosynthesis
MKILFLVPYPLKKSPSQRFRFEQYLDLLVDKGFVISVRSFLSNKGWDIIYSEGRTLAKISAIVGGFLRRLLMLPEAARADFVFIHREASPVGPPIFEWVIAKLFRRKIIYDFDDAIWLTDRKGEGAVEQAFRSRSKVSSICRWSYRVSGGNNFLCDYARQFNINTVFNPTTIDTRYHVPATKSISEKIVIGWTGSHTTLKYLGMIVPVVAELERRFDRLEFLVIANKIPNLPLKSLRFIEWNVMSEIDDLNKIDIGVMPLPDDEWSKGKCGFKALQYMSMGIPTVVSPVGVNTSIVENGVNGFLCSISDEWLNSLDLLIRDRDLRQRLGQQGRLTVERNYSVNSNKHNFLSLFD